MMKRIIAIIMVITLVVGNNVSVLASEASVTGQVVSEEEDVKAQEGYELIIEDGVVTGYTGTPVDVVIPEGVTGIDKGVFQGCSSLISIEIPSGVTSIGNLAFMDCESLISVEIPSGVTSIGEWAFMRCRSLTSIEIPSGVTSIRSRTFAQCYSLTSIEIPDSVTSIEEGAFLYCEALTSIEIPDGVTSIEDKVFSGCKKLTSIEIPSGVTSIGDFAFEGCYWLRSIEIPNGVTSIGDSAFVDSGLTSIEIPSGVTSIGNSVFKNCYSLTSIEIPDSVISIGDSAFYYCSSLTSIEIPDSVTSIGDSAFYHCYWLTGIKIPNGVTSIGYAAFADCGQLTSIKIPNSVTSVGENAFKGCSKLSIIKIPDSVTSIGGNAFLNCRTGFTICGIADSYAETYAKSNNISFVSIDDREVCVVVFNAVGGTNLGVVAKEVKEGQTVGTLPTVERAGFIFKGWYTDSYGGTEISENTVIMDSTMVYAHWEGLIIKDGVVTGYLGKPVNVIIPEGVTEIDDDAFYNCSLEDIKLPSTLVSIGSWAFQNCSNLKSINIPESVTSIGRSAFIDCSNLESVNIPKSVTSIGERAFLRCSSLKSINIPDGVTEIESRTFSECSSLETVVLPKKLTEIKGEVFEDCGLTSVVIPEGVVSIGPGAFAGCKNLADIQIPETVIKFGEGMSSYKDGGRHPFEETRWLENKRKENPFVIVNNILVDAATLKGNVKVPAGVTAIAGYAFCSAEVTSVVIPYGVTKIGSRAFADCENLASVKIPSSVNSIIGRQESFEEDSFALCDKLTIYGKNNSYAHTYAINENIPFVAYEEVIIKNEDVIFTSANYVYTGDEIQPKVIVRINNEELSEGTDYTVTYKNNVAAGTAEVMITGQGYYTGTVTKTFNIMPVSIKDAEVTLSATSYIYSGKENKPSVVVKCGNKTLAEGTDYTVSYVNNKAPGTATVTITGKGNYTGTTSRTFTITAADATATSIKDAKVTLSKTSYNYDGKAKKPSVTVMLGDKKLGNADYAVTYKNNKNIGTATVTIAGKGSYTGTLTKTFTIKAKKGTVFTSGSYKYKVTSSSAVAFAGLKSIKTTKVTIPKTVKYGGKTFKVTSVADKALNGKTKVTQITIGANVTKIGTSAFNGCTKLTKVTMGANVTAIGASAFKGCTNLTKISVGKKVKIIGVSAFEGCKKLKTITINSAKLKTVGKDALKGINAKATIKVPKSKLKAYQNLLKKKGQGTKVKIVKK